MRRSFLRLVVESLGWIMVVAGAFYVFSEQTLLIHYIIFTVGVFMIVFYFPYIDLKKNKHTQTKELLNGEK